MKECGLYRVVDKRAYRGHEQGTEFVAQLDARVEQRALMRGSIVRLGTVIAKPETYTFPEGWLQPATEGA